VDLHAMTAAEEVSLGLKQRLAARDEDEIEAFFGELVRVGATDAFSGAGDHGAGAVAGVELGIDNHGALVFSRKRTPVNQRLGHATPGLHPQLKFIIILQ
jgi:hypothetical protein